MAFNVTFSFNNGAVTGTATSIGSLRQAMHNYAKGSAFGYDYRYLTQCTLSGTAEGDLITSISGTGLGEVKGLFYNFTALTSVDLSNLDTSAVTDMKGMFEYCSSLTSLDLSNLDTSNVTDMSYMFRDCSNLEHIYVVDDWDTSNVTTSNAMFQNCTKLPNYNSSVVDKTNAHTGTGGYLNSIADLINTAEIYYKYGSSVFKLKAGENFPTIEVTATGSYAPSASSNSNYGACINKDGYMVIYAYSYSTAYEHYYWVNTSIPSTFGTIADGWNQTSWDTSDNATHLECCTIKGIDVSKYNKIKVALNFTSNNSTYDYIRCDVTITTE